MNFNPEIQNEMIAMEYIDSPFCDQQLKLHSTIHGVDYEEKVR